ncbi:unnamed protein product [Ectocarpus sp. CCAP 1310/34]|nr:unnamed protein product [Ectocarpus sp. CCAP 1310/34]
MECEFFMGPLGKGSWHEWEDNHLVALLATLWYNISRSDSSCISWRRVKNLVFRAKGVMWICKFIRPAETRWMVIRDAAALLEERWDESTYMLDDPLIRVHAKFCVALRKAVLSWAYNWIRGEGGYFLEGTGGVAERLPPGMRLAEAADFSLLLVKRLERSQRMSMTRLACSSFYEGKWAGSEEGFEHAVGQEVARALLLAFWPNRYESTEWKGWEEQNTFRENKLTLGMFSKLAASAEFREELERYAASAHEKKKVVSDVDVENQTPRVSGFDMIWTFPQLYEWACHAVFFAPIHQQLVESSSSTYDTGTQKHDSRELDIVRLGQFSSRGSRRVERLDSSNQEIRDEGDKAIAVATVLKKSASHAVPNERQLRNGEHDWRKFLKDKSEKSKHGSKWVVKSVMEEVLSSSEESESEASENLSCTSEEESGDHAEP